MLVNLHPLPFNYNDKIKETMNTKGNFNYFLGSTRPFKTQGRRGKGLFNTFLRCVSVGWRNCPMWQQVLLFF